MSGDISLEGGECEGSCLPPGLPPGKFLIKDTKGARPVCKERERRTFVKRSGKRIGDKQVKGL